MHLLVYTGQVSWLLNDKNFSRVGVLYNLNSFTSVKIFYTPLGHITQNTSAKTDEGSVPEMRIWSILLIQSDLKWCIYLSRSLFLYPNYLVSVTAGGPASPRGHM